MQSEKIYIFALPVEGAGRTLQEEGAGLGGREVLIYSQCPAPPGFSKTRCLEGTVFYRTSTTACHLQLWAQGNQRP